MTEPELDTIAAAADEFARLKAGIDHLQAELDRILDLWPDTRGSAPVVYQHGDDTWWLESFEGRWPGMKAGPYATKREAVLAYLESADANPKPATKTRTRS